MIENPALGRIYLDLGKIFTPFYIKIGQLDTPFPVPTFIKLQPDSLLRQTNMRSWVTFCMIVILSSGCASKKYLTRDYLKEKYSNEQSEYQKIGGNLIHYRDEGQGPAVVLIHGISSSLHTWDAWTTSLKEDYRVVRFDLPGFGLTGPHDENEYSIDGYVAVVDTLLQRLDISQCYLVGNSLGGWVAWEYAYQNPETVSKLVLIDAAGFATPDDPPKPIRMAQKPIFKKLVVKGAPKFLVRKYLKQAYGDRAKVHADLVLRYFELSNHPGNPLAFYTIANSSYQSNTARLSGIAAPTLIMWGAEDKKWIDVSHAYLFQELLPDNQLIIYPGVGHLPMEEAPFISVQDVLKFFRKP